VQLLPGVAVAYSSLRTQAKGSVVVAGSVYLVAEWKEAMLTESEEQK
jgi:hypothetical protein